MNRRAPALLCLLTAACLAAVVSPAAAELDPGLLAGMKARSIGPATMSGRVAAVAGVASDPDVLYVGAASGGLWRSTDGGLAWKPLFDDQPVASIGAVAVDASNPDVLWVGTGESNPRNSVSVGNGVYRSLDGGRTWKHLGLDKTESISRILLDPRRPDTAWVAALGTAWGESADRGVFKTTDGGVTWKKVLYVDERTGAADLAIDPRNPDKLFAALWDFRRWPWFFRSGGPGSGLYVTHDGGGAWKRLTEDDGLPKGDLGRIGLAIAPSDPDVVYALVEADKSALLRSEDGGVSFKAVNQDPAVATRPFYFCHIAVDPADPNRLYNLFSRATVSDDGGRSFHPLIGFRQGHPDHHAIWIDPADPSFILEGNDGGVTISRDRGKTWQFARNLPLAQYYHVRVDGATPYNVYGGLQDNGSWKGPSTVWENGGIRNFHWQELDFGDGFDTVPDPRDPTTGYAMSQEGYLVRYDLATGERKDVRPAAPAGTRLRFNWNAAIAIDPFDPDTLYFGSQFVHKSTDRGESWTIASPDLTTNDPDWQKQDESGGLSIDASGAENFTTLVSIAPSPVERGVLWTGSDDGRIHVTRDGGATWTSVEGNVRGVPKNTWVPHLRPSHFDAATAYAVFDNHRRTDWTPYVYRTTDFGKTWSSLATPVLRGYALSIEEDPVDRDLLFLGTELGLWVSQDGGKRWMQWKHGLPTVSVMDLAIEPRSNDLVIATHGRGLYILDDVSPLRTLSEQALAAPLHLFDVPAAQQYRVAQGASSRFAGDGELRGENRAYGALVTFSLSGAGLPYPDDEKERQRKEEKRQAEAAKRGGAPGEPAVAAAPSEEASATPETESEEEPAGGSRGERAKGPKAEIVVKDEAGKTLRTQKQPVTLGLNRVAWDLRADSFKEPPRGNEESFFEPRGPEVLPGTYQVTVRYGGHEATAPVTVVADPRRPVESAAREANWQAIERAGKLQETIAGAVDRITKTRADLTAVGAKARALDKDKGKAEGTDESTGEAEGTGTGEAGAAGAGKELAKRARDLGKRLDELEHRLWVPPKTKGLLPDNDALAKVRYVLRSLSSSWDAPSPAQLAYLGEAESLLAGILGDFNQLFAGDVAALRRDAAAAGLELLPDRPPLEIGK